jgi:hypothetical protein
MNGMAVHPDESNYGISSFLPLGWIAHWNNTVTMIHPRRNCHILNRVHVPLLIYNINPPWWRWRRAWQWPRYETEWHVRHRVHWLIWNICGEAGLALSESVLLDFSGRGLSFRMTRKKSCQTLMHGFPVKIQVTTTHPFRPMCRHIQRCMFCTATSKLDCPILLISLWAKKTDSWDPGACACETGGTGKVDAGRGQISAGGPSGTAKGSDEGDGAAARFWSSGEGPQDGWDWSFSFSCVEMRDREEVMVPA